MQTNTLGIMVLPKTASGNRIAVTTGTVFLFQKVNIGFLGFVLLELFKDPQFSLRKAASSHQYIVDCSLRNIKSRTIFRIGMVDNPLLFFLRRQWLFIRIQPCIHKDHALNTGCHRPPLHIHFSLTTQIRATPHVEHIVIGSITGSLSVAENLFNEGVIKESLNKIAAFLSVRMGLKECGNFYSMVF